MSLTKPAVSRRPDLEGSRGRGREPASTALPVQSWCVGFASGIYKECNRQGASAKLKKVLTKWEDNLPI